ncbi:hypothetical protein MNB_SV-5-652 [hydrothermal vent metagenome]|uniref:DNA binding HTH domain-containing protein n=1 Tax=hydrothermal vent metagenome TaxID=652676 RepID=A0A1W1EG29_9ZZZZ
MTQFLTNSEHVQNIVKGLNLTKTLIVSSIIIGEANIGKKLLARSIFPTTHIVSGEDQEAVEEALREYDELIITDFEKLSNQESLNLENKRIIATANYVANQNTIDNLFAFIYTMPPLRERMEDVEHLKEIYINEVKENLMLEDEDFSSFDMPIDLTQNSKSMKKGIYKFIMTQSMKKEDIQLAVHNYILNNLNGINGYKEHIELYEKPLIIAGLKKFGSQLKLAQVLGINRNTLRKKLHEHGIN